MRVRAASAALVAMAVLALGALPAAAASTSVQASVAGGGDTVTFDNLPSTVFSSVTLSATFGAQETSAAIPGSGNNATDYMIGLDDATGTDPGWVASVQATPLTEVTPSSGFASGTSAITLPEGSLEMGAPAGIYAESGQASTATVPTIDLGATTAIDGSAPVDLASASAGTGAGSWGVSWANTADFLVANMSNNARVVDSTNYPSSPTPYASTITVTLTEN